MAQDLWAEFRVGAPQAAPQPMPAPPRQDPIIKPADPYRQSAEQRAQRDQQLQEEANARAAAADARAAEAEARAARKDTMGTVEQGKSASFLKRAVNANTNYSSLGDVGPRSLVGQAAADSMPGITNYFSDASRQKAEQAEREFIAAVLRYDSGAAIPPEEFVTNGKIYFPRPGDTPEVIAQKAQARRVAIEGLKASAGPAGSDVQIPDFDALFANAANGAQGGGNGDGLRQYKDEQGNIINEEDVVGSVDRVDGNDPAYMQLAAGVGDIVEAGGDLLGIVGNPLNATINALAGTNLSTDMGGTLRRASGLPQGDPWISAINQGIAGGLLFGGAPAAIARYVPAAARNALLQIGANPVGDAIVGGAAAGAGEGAKAADLGPGAQAAATLLGGVAGSGVASRFGRVPANTRIPPNGPTTPTDPNQIVVTGKDWNVPVFTSDVAPPTTVGGKSARLLGETIPIAGTGGGLGGRATQQVRRQDATERFIQELGGAKADIDEVTRDFVATRSAQLSKLTTAKNTVIDSVQNPVSAIQMRNTLRTIDQQIAKLASANAEAFAPVINKLNSFREVLSSGKSLREIEMNRRLLGDIFEDANLSSIKGDGQKAINAIYDPLRKDMGDAIEASLGSANRAKWQKANDQLAKMAGDLDESKFKQTLNKADVTPEKVASLLFSKTPSDLRRLFGNLSEVGKNKARSALIYKAAEGAIDGDNISPDKFKQGLKAIDTATGIFFSPADKARIDGFERLLQATQRAATATTEVMTGARNTAFVGGIGLQAVFGNWTIPAGAMVGLLARAYESGPARDLILKLGKTKPGSPAEAAVGTRLRDYLSRAVVTQAPANDVGASQIVTRSATAASAEEPEK